MSRIILEIESLYKTYGEKENAAEALRGISFQVYQGEFLGIMGSSGSGKTTLLNCIASVLRPTRGRILLKGQDIGMYTDAQLAAYRGRQIGYLFQQFELLDNLKIFFCRHRFTKCRKRKAEKGCRSWRNILRSRRCWKSFRIRCPEDRSRG